VKKFLIDVGVAVPAVMLAALIVVGGLEGITWAQIALDDKRRQKRG
jgi:Na+(H+)/acetate symporter ActP